MVFKKKMCTNWQQDNIHQCMVLKAKKGDVVPGMNEKENKSQLFPRQQPSIKIQEQRTRTRERILRVIN